MGSPRRAVLGAEGWQLGLHDRQEGQGSNGCCSTAWAKLVTDPARLALILDGLLGVRHSPLHVVHRMLHVVLNPVNHLPLHGRGHLSSRGDSRQGLGEAL